MTSPRTTVVIPTWNRADLLDACLAAVSATATCRVIVVDNGSEDHTEAVVSAHDAEYIRNEENLGFAKACNQGALAATTELLCFLNNDTEPRGDWLAVMEAQASRGLVGCRIETMDGRLHHAGVDIHPITFVVWDEARQREWTMRFPMLPRERREEHESGYVDAVTGACLLIDRELFAELGGFDEGYRNGYEDMALNLRASWAGHRSWYESRATIMHHVSASGTERFLHNAENLKRLQWQCLEHQREITGIR